MGAYFFIYFIKSSDNVIEQTSGGMLMRRVMIYGAGEAGRMVLAEIRRHREDEFQVIGFFDDDPSKKGKLIDGLEVFGGMDKIRELIKRYRINEVIISMPSISKKVIKEIVAHCKAERVSVLIVPSTMEIIRGTVRYDQIKKLDLSDLLEREEINLNKERIMNYIEGKKILVTGAAGSIGSEIVKKLLDFNPAEVIALDINESGLFYLLQDIGFNSLSGTKVIPVIGDIKDRVFLEGIFENYNQDIVFHAAAYKHVPLMEVSPRIAFINNVIGTLNLLEVSLKAGLERFIGISTDKAVYPLSVMGKTKRLTELLIKAFSKKGLMGCSVRFGNVLGSNGSVVNIFNEQIKHGGPVTVTSPEMERFFMTVNEAVNLVMEAGSIAENGDVYVLDMGEPIKIKDLAETLIVLSGYIPGVDIKLEYTGIRLGERIKERLFHEESPVEKSEFDGIYVEKNSVVESDFIDKVKMLYDKIYIVNENEIINSMNNLISLYSNIPVKCEVAV